MAEELRKRALALYTPPFYYDSFGGYIWDAKQNMVADNHVDGDQVLRVRGWGRIVYMENPEELQDEFGAMLAEALTEYVERRNGSEEGHVVVPLELLKRIRSQLDLRAEFDPTYPPETQPVNDDARLFLELRALLGEGKEVSDGV